MLLSESDGFLRTNLVENSAGTFIIKVCSCLQTAAHTWKAKKRMKAEEYLNQIPMWTREKNSQKDIRRILGYLGNPDRKIPVIHVAGTNGKGSVCAYLTSALKEAGYRVGTFVSPHLVEIRERFLLNGEMVGTESFQKAFEKVKEAADQAMEDGLRHPTFFEFLFYMAACLFAEEKVDFWVMETGLGGRLDTTNVVERPLLTVITSISLDHTRYLGETVEAIAGEKAGIIKEGIPVIFSDGNSAASGVILKTASQRHAPGYPVNSGYYRVIDEGAGKLTAEIRNLDGKMQRIRIPFPAAYQGENAAIAWKCLSLLIESGILDADRKEALVCGMEATKWPGRMEEVLPGVFLDGAHNPGGIQAFIQAALRIKEGRGGRILLLFAAVEDKDYGRMIESLCEELSPELTAAVRLKSERGLSAAELARCFQEKGNCPAFGFEDAKEAFSFILSEKGEGDLVFCAGSLYLIGELKEIIRRRYDKL